MKMTTKRLGRASGLPVTPNAENDSSHGSAMVTPAPCRMARREMREAEFFRRVGMSIALLPRRARGRSGGSFVSKLSTGNDGLHQRQEAVAAGSGSGFHLID